MDDGAIALLNLLHIMGLGTPDRLFTPNVSLERQR